MVAHRMTSHRGWLVDNRPPREGGSVWQIFTLEQLKVTLGISPRKPPTHRSVGRYRQGHHRLILPLCRLRLNAPPQDRLHRSNVTMLRASPIYRTVNRLELFIRLPSLLCSPSKWLTITTCKAGVTLSIHPCKPSWEVYRPPRHIENETPARPLPHYGKIRKTEFSNGAFFLALLCKPPLERIT